MSSVPELHQALTFKLSLCASVQAPHRSRGHLLAKASATHAHDWSLARLSKAAVSLLVVLATSSF